MPEEMEMAGGGYNAQAGVTTTVKAVWYSGPNRTGKRIDLGTIVGPRTKEEGRKTDKLLKKLKVDRIKKEKKQKEMNHG